MMEKFLTKARIHKVPKIIIGISKLFGNYFFTSGAKLLLHYYGTMLYGVPVKQLCFGSMEYIPKAC